MYGKQITTSKRKKRFSIRENRLHYQPFLSRMSTEYKFHWCVLDSSMESSSDSKNCC
jgi:hypothetical protein